MSIVLIVTGWRGATQAQHGRIIADALDPYRAHRHVTLRHGRCPYGGVDLIAANLAETWGWTVEAYPALVVNGRIQGPARNRAMCAAEPRADQVLAFPGPGSLGTWDCLHWAARHDIPFRGYPLTITKGQTR
jgi:hypothetical protein